MASWRIMIAIVWLFDILNFLNIFHQAWTVGGHISWCYGFLRCGSNRSLDPKCGSNTLCKCAMEGNCVTPITQSLSTFCLSVVTSLICHVPSESSPRPQIMGSLSHELKTPELSVKSCECGMVVRICNTSSWEKEAGGLKIPGQHELLKETVSWVGRGANCIRYFTALYEAN